MGLFTDILKGLPENAVLRSKVAEAEERYGALETENAILKDDLHDAKAEITKLKKQIEELSHKDDLGEIEVQILTLISQHERENSAPTLARALNVTVARVEHYLQTLVESDHIGRRIRINDYSQHYLLKKGSATLIERNLI